MVVAFRNLSDLNKRVASVCSRLKKEDCLDLPPKTFTTRVCALSGEQTRVYRELRRDAVARLNKLRADAQLTCANVLTEALRLLQCVGGYLPDDTGVMHRFSPNPKIALLREVLAEDPGAPAVIWASFREEVSGIAATLADDGANVSTFHGGLTAAEREAVLADFKAGRAQYLIATPQSGGMGISLTTAALEVFYSRTYNAGDYWQAIDRLHRPGQTRPVTVVNLVADDTVDGKVMAALEQKGRMQEWLMSRAVEEIV
jgi:SNF2 family DNA or RNA helicase